MMAIETQIQEFKDRVMTDPIGVLDPETEHHEFVSGNHGRKLDFDKIEEGTDFYEQWVEVYAGYLQDHYGDHMPDALVGIANGANRLSRDVAAILGGGVLGLETVKKDAKTVELAPQAREALMSRQVMSALLIEDVGTTGGTMSTLVTPLRDMRVERIEAVTTWQRTPRLPRLDELGIVYHSMIPEVLPTFTPEECAESGYCADGLDLIKHGQ